MKKVYISGKIGEEVISLGTRLKFANAEEMMKAKGYEVFNPCSEEWQFFLEQNWSAASSVAVMDKYTYILLKDIQKLAKCDAVLFLSDTYNSPGASSEYYFAKACGKHIMFTNKDQAICFLRFKWIDEVRSGQISLEEADKGLNLYVEQNIDKVWIH